MEFKKEDEDDVCNPVGEAAVSFLFWITVLLALGALGHKLFF